MEKEELVKVYDSTRKVVVNEIKAVLSDTKAELCDFFQQVRVSLSGYVLQEVMWKLCTPQKQNWTERRFLLTLKV